ncbi:hypothetical protein BDV37DRAFT_279898 [Aspergillus pseudonomiae]|uniref:Uncharacterized protein n=1 Tax=Aspergillus pseudonomiae TaxID=1506151 RepID=A0A5N7DLU8_9EURO|nr:uncharacterized protein BDV37DRAFT_279898 [Aspergillus pseudonomiae]KAE8407364.1 hypothetical protein BDV37DRAFT_279898 [Aspergillus pseudonomiae]
MVVMISTLLFAAIASAISTPLTPKPSPTPGFSPMPPPHKVSGRLAAIRGNTTDMNCYVELSHVYGCTGQSDPVGIFESGLCQSYGPDNVTVNINICDSAKLLLDFKEALLEFSNPSHDLQVWKLPQGEPGKFIETGVDSGGADQPYQDNVLS